MERTASEILHFKEMLTKSQLWPYNWMIVQFGVKHNFNIVMEHTAREILHFVCHVKEMI